MKKILLGLFLTGCAGYKSLNRTSSTSRQMEQAEYEQVSSKEKRAGFNLLEQHVKGDSAAYQVLIRADGPFRLQPDSGISGAGATIWLNGSRWRYEAGKKQLDSNRLDSQGSRAGAKHFTEQQQAQAEIQSRKWTLNSYWLLVPAGVLLLGWLIWKKLF